MEKCWVNIQINLFSVEVISGSLGHGLSIGAGMALADKFDNKNHRKHLLF